MMPRATLILLTLLYALPAASAPQAPLLALCYHDVVATHEETLRDPTAVTVDTLVQHLSWLSANGYETVSLAQWRVGRDLPEKPLLLTFDDGFLTFRRRIQFGLGYF